MPSWNWSSSTTYVAGRCKWGSFSECNYADGNWQERFSCLREDDAPNHQSPIWRQFGRAGRPVNPEAMILESWPKRIPPYVCRCLDRPLLVLIILVGRRQKATRIATASNRSFAATKPPIIIFLHQTINSPFDMIAMAANGNPDGWHALLLCVIMYYCR